MSQLAELIRKKYPGVYDDMDDNILEKSVLDKHPEYKDLAQSEQPSLASKTWETANKPLLKFTGGLDDAMAYELSAPPSRLRGFLTGANQGANQLLSELTSPLNLTMLAATEGTEPLLKAGYPAAAKGLSRLGRAVSAGVGLHGAEKVVDPKSTLSERLMGVAEAAGGAAGAYNDPFGRANIRLQAERMGRPPVVGVADLGNVPREGQKPGPRFYADEPPSSKTIDINNPETPPIRSREVPYRPADSYTTAEGDTALARETFNKLMQRKAKTPSGTVVDDISPTDLPERPSGPWDNNFSAQPDLPVRSPEDISYDIARRKFGIELPPEPPTVIPNIRPDLIAGRDPFRGPLDWGRNTYDEDLMNQVREEIQKTRNQEFVNPDEPANERLQRFAAEAESANKLNTKFDIFDDIPDLTGQTIMTGERVRDLLGVEPKDALNRGWVVKDESQGTSGYRSTQNKPTAQFKGWQQTGYEDMPDFPLYDVNAPGHPSHGTTTDASGLAKLGIDVPETPPNPHALPIRPEGTTGLSAQKPEMPSSFEPAEDQTTGGIYPTKNQEVMDKFLQTFQDINKAEGSDRAGADLENIFKKPSDEEPQFSRILNFDPKQRKQLADIRDEKDKGTAYERFRYYEDQLSRAVSNKIPEEQINKISELRDNARTHYYDLIGAKAVDRGPIEGDQGLFPEQKHGLHRNETTKDQWNIARKEAQILGIDPAPYKDNLAALQWDITKKTAQETIRTGKNPLKTKGEEPPEGMEPLFAKSEKGGAKIGANIKRAADELTSGYTNPLESIMQREMMKNALDAVRELGENGKVHVEIGENSISISDNGRGMSSDELRTVYTNLHESGRTTESGAAGGKGVGKAPFILGGEHFRVETVKDIGGRKIKSIMEGTPEQFMEHVDINEQPVPYTTLTGTKATVKLKSDQEAYRVRDMFKNIIEKSRGLKAKVTSDVYANSDRPTSPERYDKHEFNTGINDKIVDNTTVNNGTSQVKISVPKSSTLANRSGIYINYLNNGIYEFRTRMYLGEEAMQIPDEMTVDVHPLVEEGSPDYPFPVQRESIKDNIKNEIEKIIKDRLVTPATEARKSKLHELYKSLDPIPVSGTSRKPVLLDQGNRLTEEELNDITTSPVMRDIAKEFDKIIDDVLQSTERENWKNKLEQVGFLIAEPGFHGVHIPNPIDPLNKSSILINPFSHLLYSDSPMDGAIETITTILHEVAHIGKESENSIMGPEIKDEISDPRVGKIFESFLKQVSNQGGKDFGHGISWLKRLGDVFGEFGPKETLNAIDRFHSIITDNTGSYNSEIQKFLQIYEESRGRTAITEDYLSPTGIKSESPSGGKGGVERNAGPDGKRTVKQAVDKLFEVIRESKGLREEQETINRRERARRFAEYASIKGGGMRGAAQRMSKLKGEFEKVKGPTLNLSEEDTRLLFDHIDNANITVPEKIQATASLFKLIEGGRLPYRSELKALDSTFGNGFSEHIMELHGGLGIVGVRLGKTANTMKALMSTLDLSAPLRQGFGLIHKPEWRDSFVEMLKFYGNKKYFEAAMSTLEKDPYYLMGREAGLFIAKPGSLIQGEERWLNNYVGRLPGFARAATDASERAYIGFLNKLRMDVFKNDIIAAKAAGMNPFEIVEHKQDDGTIRRKFVPTKRTEDIARTINVATGRGGLGRLEKMAPELNTVFWSPRLASSRITNLNPKYYHELDPFARKEAVKSLLAMAAAGTAMLGIMKATGASVSLNPLDSDFGKARFGNHVFDPWSGHQQPVVAFSRFITGMNEVKPQNRWDTIVNFTTSKFGPMADLIYDLVTAKEFNTKVETGSILPPAAPGFGGYTDRFNNQKYLNREVMLRFAPIFGQDMADLLTDNPTLAKSLGFGVLSALGGGVQDYPDRGAKRRATTRKPKFSF